MIRPPANLETSALAGADGTTFCAVGFQFRKAGGSTAPDYREYRRRNRRRFPDCAAGSVFRQEVPLCARLVLTWVAMVMFFASALFHAYPTDLLAWFVGAGTGIAVSGADPALKWRLGLKWDIVRKEDAVVMDVLRTS